LEENPRGIRRNPTGRCFGHPSLRTLTAERKNLEGSPRSPICGLTAVAAVLLLGSCSVYGDTFGPSDGRNPQSGTEVETETEPKGILTPDQMVAEYWSTTKKYPLPSGAKWIGAKDLPAAPGEKGVMRGNSYEQGYGTVLAEDEWFCTWAREWITARGETAARENKALKTMLKYPDTDSWQATDEPTRELMKGYLSKAELGDPSGISFHVENNCS
jgi:hypothetical protein